MSKKHRLLASLVTAAALSALYRPPPTFATVGPEANSRDCSIPTSVIEHNYTGGARNFIVHVTGPGGPGDEIGKFDLGTIAAGGAVKQNINPKDLTNPGKNCDAWNESTPVPPPAGGGGKVNLFIEAVFLDPATQLFFVGSYGAVLLDTLGNGVGIGLPDFWADDGTTTLYEAVNLAELLPTIPVYAPGDDVTVVNGAIAGLPGYLISTTPIGFDPANGLTGTPWNGTASILTDHNPSTIPEPTALLAMLPAVAAITFRKRRRGGSEAPSLDMK